LKCTVLRNEFISHNNKMIIQITIYQVLDMNTLGCDYKNELKGA